MVSSEEAPKEDGEASVAEPLSERRGCLARLVSFRMLALVLFLGALWVGYGVWMQPSAEVVLCDVEKVLRTEVVLEKVRYTAAYRVENVTRGLKPWLLGAYKHRGRVPVEITLGFDLEQLGASSIVKQLDGGYTVMLPPIEILDVKIDLTSPACDVEVRGSLARRLWDRQLGAPSAMDESRQVLASLTDEGLLTSALTTALQADVNRVGEAAKERLTRIFASVPYTVTFVFPPTTVEDLVQRYLNP